jgi:radical SAM superfamily enzyme
MELITVFRSEQVYQLLVKIFEKYGSLYLYISISLSLHSYHDRVSQMHNHNHNRKVLTSSMRS